MEFKIEKAALLSGLYLAQGISDRKSTMPILANVLLRTDGKDKLLVAATDLNVTVTAELPCKVVNEGGLTVGAKHLHDIVKSLPGEDLGLKRTENQYAEIRAGKVDYKVVGMADRDFPKLPNHREVKFGKVDAATLRDMIAKTFFSISTDETRYHLNGVLFESDGTTARMVSTDGHRLSKVERPLEGGPKLAQGIIVPRKGLMEVRRALETAEGAVELGIHNGHLFVRVGDDGAQRQAHRRAVPAVRAGHPEGERQDRDRAAARAPGGAQAHQHHVVGQDLGHQARRSPRAS